MENIIRFSVSLPKQLLDELDSKIGAQGYASRSEFTRDLRPDRFLKSPKASVRDDAESA